MPADNSRAIAEAQLDAYIDEIRGNPAKEQALVAIAQHDEAELHTFVDKREDFDTVVVYNVMDGTSSTILVSMLSKQLRKRFPRSAEIPERLWGKRAFALEKPELAAKPVFTCWFHPDSPKKEGLRAVGFGDRVCAKANIPDVMNVVLHMQRKHPQEYKIIEANRAEMDRQEERTLRRQEVEAMQAMAGMQHTMNTTREVEQVGQAPAEAAPAAGKRG